MLKGVYTLTGAMTLMALVSFISCSTDDSYKEPQEQTVLQTPITFDSYLGRSSSRGSISSSKSLCYGGIGIFAMYSEGKYDPANSTGSSVNTEFDDNFMSNIRLTGNSDGTWEYSPLRYWPANSNEYISFLFYGPASAYNAPITLYSIKDNTISSSDGDRTWIKHEVAKTPNEQVDLLRNSTGTTNMQNFYSAETNSTNYIADDNSAITEDGVVNLKMIHVCSRISVVVSAPYLGSADYFNADETESNTKIKVNKVMLLGDDISATETIPKGTFIPSAYLNLAGKAEKNASGEYTTDFWNIQETDPDSKLAFTFDSFVSGDYNTAAGQKWIPADNENNEIKATATTTTTETTTTDETTGETTTTTTKNTTYDVNKIGTKNTDYLFVIPQDFSATEETSDKLYCYINYTIYKEGTENSETVCDVYGQLGKANFKSGGAYVIYIELSEEIPIKFHVNLEPWSDESGYFVNY